MPHRLEQSARVVWGGGLTKAAGKRLSIVLDDICRTERVDSG